MCPKNPSQSSSLLPVNIHVTYVCQAADMNSHTLARYCVKTQTTAYYERHVSEHPSHTYLYTDPSKTHTGCAQTALDIFHPHSIQGGKAIQLMRWHSKPLKLQKYSWSKKLDAAIHAKRKGKGRHTCADLTVEFCTAFAHLTH